MCCRGRPRISKHSRNGFTINIQLFPDEIIATPIHTCTKRARVNRRCYYLVRVLRSFSLRLCQSATYRSLRLRGLGIFPLDNLAQVCRSVNRTVAPVSSHVTTVHGPHTTAHVSLLNSAPCHGTVIPMSPLQNVATRSHGE